TDRRASSRRLTSSASQPLRIPLAGAVRVVGERRREVRVGMPMAMIVAVAVAVVVIMMVVVVHVIMVVVVVVMMMIIIMVMVAVIVIVTMVVAMIVIVAVPRGGADAFHVMVMVFLHAADLGFVADRLFAVFAHLAIHRVIASEDLAHQFGERV